MHKYPRAKVKPLALTLAYCLLLVVPLAFIGAVNHQDVVPSIEWQPGPVTADLGDNVAQLELAEGLIFAGGRDTKDLMEYMGNPLSGGEVGLVMSDNEYQDWFILFEYDPVGYVKDDEGDSIDAEAILEAIKEGNDQANKERRDRGFSPLHILGWHTAPHYDRASHNLVWALLAEDDSGQVVNYNTRLLGRHGYMSAILVTDPPTLDSALPQVEEVLGGFSYKEGKRYTEFVQGDKVAQFGLTGLLAGGAGAVAAKTGLLAKMWKFLAGGAVAGAAVIVRVFKSIFGGKNQGATST